MEHLMIDVINLQKNIIPFPEWRINNEYILVPILAFKDPFNLDDNYCFNIFAIYINIDGEEKILDESNKRNDFLEYHKI